eukprot:9369953-Pyramimonas_sp.AAC.1
MPPVLEQVGTEGANNQPRGTSRKSEVEKTEGSRLKPPPTSQGHPEAPTHSPTLRSTELLGSARPTPCKR